MINVIDRKEVEASLGFDYFAYQERGLSILKTRVDDFRVKEQARTPSLDPKGKVHSYQATLRDWETNRFIGRLASACKISRNRIFFRTER